MHYLYHVVNKVSLLICLPVKSCKAEQQYQHRIIDVETIRYKIQHTHRAHDLTGGNKADHSVLQLVRTHTSFGRFYKCLFCDNKLKCVIGLHMGRLAFGLTEV